MGLPVNAILGYCPPIGGITAAVNTAWIGGIEPAKPNDNVRKLFTVDPSQISNNNNVAGLVGFGGWLSDYAIGFTHIDKIIVTTGLTAVKFTLLKPLNWSYTTVASAQNTNTMTLKDNPGAYSTNYRYPLPKAQAAPAAVSDATVTANDYVAYQLVDGTWVFDTVVSFNTTTLLLTLTTTIPAVTGGGVSANQAVFYLGNPTLKDPATGGLNWQTTSVLNTNRQDLVPDYLVGFLGSMHRGDPLIFYSPNTSATSGTTTLDCLTAFGANP